MIGPRGAFGVHVEGLHPRRLAEVRAIMDRLVVHHGRGPQLRASLARWGLDPAVATRRERAFLPAWLADQVVRGAIDVVVVPDPTLAYSGFVDSEERVAAAVRLAILPRPMAVSALGRRVLAAHEGIVLRRYRGRDGEWRIGVGHGSRDGNPDPAFHNGAIAVEEAVRLFRRDLQGYEREVTAALEIGVEQHEFDALVSFHFGTRAFVRSDIARRLNMGDRDGAAAAFLTPAGQPEERARRMAEMAMFRDGVYPALTARVFETLPNSRVERERGRPVDLVPLLGFSAQDGRLGSLPPTIEERLILALTRVPGRLAGEVREMFLGLLGAVGIGRVVSSLLVWNAGAVATPLRMDLGLLAYDQAALSSPVVRATRSLAAALGKLRDIQGRDELAPVVEALAAAISVLIVHRLFDRLLAGVKIAKGNAVHAAQQASKPSLPKNTPRQARAPMRPAAAAPVATAPAVAAPETRPECVKLAAELDQINDALDKAALASAVYDKPIDPATLPKGWQEASPDDLKELGLVDSNGNSLLEIPGSDFRAAVFKKGEEYVVAFKGTSPLSKEDWQNNINQARDQPARYYGQAALIARKVSQAQGKAVEFVGHSLGGGLASAAAAAADKPATTFNAAGLNPATVPRYAQKAGDSARTKAYHVVGDVLSEMQDGKLGRMAKAAQAAGERIPLDPASRVTIKDAVAALAGLVFGGPLGAAIAGTVYRGVRLHGMDSVTPALKKKAKDIVKEQVKKGCIVG